MRLRETVDKIYFDEAPITEKSYQRSKTFFVLEGATARVILSLTSGAFLAGYAELLGADDRLNGVIAALPTLAAAIQIFSPMVFEKLGRRKFLIGILSLMHRILLGLMVLIPLISRNTTTRLLLLSSMFLVSYVLVSFINPAFSNWIADMIPARSRGRYFGMREAYILAAVTVMTLVMGVVVDYFKDGGREYIGFVVLFAVVLILAGANFAFVSSIKEIRVPRSRLSLDLASIITIPLKDKVFRKFIFITLLWNIGLQIAGPYFSVYMVTGLKLDYTFIMAMSLLASATNVVASTRWGRLADRKSWVFTTKISVGLLAATHFFWLTVGGGTAFIMVPLLHIASGIAWAGINISLFNLQFTLSPESGRTVYLGFSAALGGITGFGSTLLGSLLLKTFENYSFSLVLTEVGNMQLLFAASGLLLGICTAYIHFFVPQKKAD